MMTRKEKLLECLAVCMWIAIFALFGWLIYIAAAALAGIIGWPIVIGLLGFVAGGCLVYFLLFLFLAIGMARSF